MSNKTRRALARANKTLGRKQLADDMCRLCGFLLTEIVGNKEHDFILSDGTKVELGINKRLEPPLGVRFPKTAAKRHGCLVCGGTGRTVCADCQGHGHDLTNKACQTCQGNGKVACEGCAGLGYVWTRDDFAPLCLSCSQYLMVWLKERETLAIARQGSPVSRIILPGDQTRGSLGTIVRPS